MKFRLIEKGNPANPTAPRKFYANAVNSGTLDQKAIAKEIAGRSSLTTGDVANVINNFLDLLPNHLMDGKSVKLGDFGTFRITLSSEGTDTAAQFNATKIKNSKVIFTPSADFKNTLSRMSFEAE